MPERCSNALRKRRIGTALAGSAEAGDLEQLTNTALKRCDLAFVRTHAHACALPSPQPARQLFGTWSVWGAIWVSKCRLVAKILHPGYGRHRTSSARAAFKRREAKLLQSIEALAKSFPKTVRFALLLLLRQHTA